MKKKLLSGQMLVELLLAIGLAAIILPALLTGFVASRQGKAQQGQRMQAVALLKETEQAVRNIKNNNWITFANDGTFYPTLSGSAWTLASGSATINGFTQQIVISDVSRDSSGNITNSGGTVDPSTKKVSTTISWGNPYTSSISSTMYVTRTGNFTYTETTAAQFNAGTLANVQIKTITDGEVALANNNKAKWCSPAFSSATIDLPDGPPVAVAATASAVTTAIPNDVFVGTAPYATSSVKLAYVAVSANTDPPIATLSGTFTLDSSKYSAPGLVPSGIGITNSFRTNDVKYYTSTGGNLYALLATDIADHEILAIQIKSGGHPSYQDSTNKIFKYWTFFNTKQYPTSSGNDQAPFGYGAVSMTILGNTGYLDSGGYLYAFNLSNIDSKSAGVGLDQVGCRILLDGADCQPSSAPHPNGFTAKYSAGETGNSYSTTGTPSHATCADGGNIELEADHQLSPVQVGANKYVYVAVGAATNPELNIIDVTTPPTGATLSGSSCGRGSNAGWKVTGNLDFDPAGGTEEAANSVYAKSDGTRAYMSSNGGIIHGGIPDSDQFYIVDTTSKSTPKFLTSWSTTIAGQHYANTASSGYYNGDATNIELYPRRALTVLNGQRAIIVGQDGLPNDGIEPKEYQVINIDPNDPGGNKESSPSYCGGLNYLPGFNDLTSVSEADGDNFVYMIANTNEKQLKIIQGGPDNAVYAPSGTFESKTFDPSTVDSIQTARSFNRIFANTTLPAQTSIQMQVAVEPPISGSCNGVTFNYIGPDGTAGTYFTPANASTSAQIPFGSLLSGNYQNPGRCYRYKAFLSTLDQTQTPLLNDTTVNYSP